MMDDLHKGLLTKIYVTIAGANQTWTSSEEHVGALLFEHIWDQKLSGEALRRAIEHIAGQDPRLKWYSLLRPFDAVAPLRDRVGELETVVMRVANLIAKVDGRIDRDEHVQLNAIRGHLVEIRLAVERALDTSEDLSGGHEAARRFSVQSVQAMDTDARDVRKACDLPVQKLTGDAGPLSREQIADVLAELDGLVGMWHIKEEVHTLANFLTVQNQREKVGLPTTQVSLHMIFRGNPGTGKTTVARLIGRCLGALGVLRKGHLVETDRSGLVAEYVGQTAVKTNEKIDEALDGVLFIDEAYSLIAEAGEDPFGCEAVQVLLKRMEDDRERLVVILAGYPRPMDVLLHSNPGLASRFNHHITFNDYDVDELGRIFEIFCDKNRYEVPANVRAKILLGFQWRHTHRDERFGNGRMARNTFEKAIRRLANRIVDVVPLTKEILTTFEPADFEFPDVPDTAWEGLEEESWKFEVRCPGCDTPNKMPQKYLGHRMECNRCKHRFVAGWGKPV
ncbi:MAG: AAA family ATPase [Pirellulales bacterium]|nr:AAA family ATPase [Pirellulales bacterium]